MPGVLSWPHVDEHSWGLASFWMSLFRKGFATLFGWFEIMKCCKQQPSSLLVKLVLVRKTAQVSFFEIHICNFCGNGLLFLFLSWISNNTTEYRWFGLIAKFNLQKKVASPWSVNWSGAMWNYLCTSWFRSYYSAGMPIFYL